MAVRGPFSREGDRRFGSHRSRGVYPRGRASDAVTPGLIATETALSEEADVFDEIVPQQAIGRPGRPEEV